MRVVDESVVFKNPHPNFRALDAAAATLCWSQADSRSPFLLCAFRIGQARMSPDGHLCAMRSDDLGRSWRELGSPLQGLLGPEAPSQAGFQAGGNQRGDTLIAGARMWLTAPGRPDWDDQSAGVVDADTVLARAPAGGPWVEPVLLDFRAAADEWAIPCGPPVPFDGNDWVLPMESHALPTRADWLRRYRAFTIRSTDGGRTWTDPWPSMNSHDGSLAYYDQRMVRLPSGRLLSFAWVHDVVNDRTLKAQSGWSDDRGRTWTAPSDTGIQGGPVNPLLLRDGRLLAVYNRRTHPTGIRCCFSEDHGQSWQTKDEYEIWSEARRAVTGLRVGGESRQQEDAPLWNAMWGWTFGTPTPVQAPDGSVVVTFYGAGFDGIRAIRCVRLEVYA